jgi:hypothetical protein
MTDIAGTLAQQGVADRLVDAVSRLARDDDRNLDAHLVTVGEVAALDGTGAACRCHFVARDGNGNGNGRPRVEHLARRLADQAVDYCIPRTRFQEARDRMVRTGSAETVLALQREAKELFTHLENSGEGGEMLLYLLLEVELGIPQLLCKTPLKTNPEVHYHGVDGVHGKVTDTRGRPDGATEDAEYSGADTRRQASGSSRP